MPTNGPTVLAMSLALGGATAVVLYGVIAPGPHANNAVVPPSISVTSTPAPVQVLAECQPPTVLVGEECVQTVEQVSYVEAAPVGGGSAGSSDSSAAGGGSAGDGGEQSVAVRPASMESEQPRSEESDHESGEDRHEDSRQDAEDSHSEQDSREDRQGGSEQQSVEVEHEDSESDG